MANLTDADKVLRNDTGKDIASKLDAIKTAIQNQSTTLNNLADVSILSVQDGQFLKYDSTEQRWVNVSLPDPMVFKGTLGTGGTITDLPVDGSANVGDTYKVIEDGTYATVSAKVGDLFSCLTKTSVANTWVLIPSGDESFTDTWRGIKVNGTEKLASSISSGEVDFVEGSNVQITFDTTGNKIVISATDTTYSEATQSTSGLMSASDKTKLDTMPTTADTQPITNGSAVNTKSYIDTKTTLVKSASGSLIHITDGGDNIPLKSCEITIEPDLSGKTEANLVVCGKNLFSQSLELGSIDANGQNSGDGSSIRCRTIGYISIPNSTLIVSNNLNATVGCFYYDTNKTFISLESWESSPKVLNIPDNAKFVRFVFQITASNMPTQCQLEKGNQATAYEQYNGTTYNIPFGQTVYGGEGDVTTGEFVIPWGHQVYDGSVDENWIVETTLAGINFYIPVSDAQRPCYLNDIIIDGYESCPSPVSHRDKGFISYGGNFNITIGNTLGIDNVNDFKTWLSNNNLIITYKLATPTSLTLTPTSPKTISGINNIYNDCGDTDIEYFTSSADEESELIEVKAYSKSEVDTKLANKEDKATVLSGTLTAGQTSITLSDASITTTSTIDIYTDAFGVQPTNAVVTSGQIVLTFFAQNSDISVKVRVS